MNMEVKLCGATILYKSNCDEIFAFLIKFTDAAGRNFNQVNCSVALYRIELRLIMCVHTVKK